MTAGEQGVPAGGEDGGEMRVASDSASGLQQAQLGVLRPFRRGYQVGGLSLRLARPEVRFRASPSAFSAAS